MAVETKTAKNGAINRVADSIPTAMSPKILTFTVTGLSPLLQNNPANFIGMAEADDLGSKKEYNDEEEAALRVYKTEAGQFYHPTQAFIRSMVKAVTGKKFGKMFATKAISSAVFIAEPHSIILDAKGKPAKQYTIDRQPCVVGKARILRCRPCWIDWSMKIALDVDTKMLTRRQVQDALSVAGRTIGIGDYRPEKSGGFGRFTVS